MSDIIEFSSQDSVSVIHLEILTPIITIGDNLEFTFTLQNTGNFPVRTAIQYEIICQTAGGDRLKQIYNFSNRLFSKGFLLFHQTQRLDFDPSLTILPGRQQLSILINGNHLKTAFFDTINV